MKTKRGGECKYCQKYGERCPVHSLSAEALAERNYKAVEAARQNNPKAFVEQRRRGWQKAKSIHGLEKLQMAARARRLENPSLPERRAMDILGTKYDYEREVKVFEDTNHTVDFVIYRNGQTFARPLAIEVTGYQFLATPFGREDGDAIRAALEAKVRRLEQEGYEVLVWDPAQMSEWEAQLNKAVEGAKCYS